MLDNPENRLNTYCEPNLIQNSHCSDKPNRNVQSRMYSLPTHLRKQLHV